MNNQFPIKTLNQLRPVLIGFRKMKGFTQKEVSERLGVTQQTYARLEAKPASASIDRLFRVFSILGIEITLSSLSPSLATTRTEMRVTFDSTPARREKW
ncbi:helix-turn-helix family protein [Enterobacter cloacae S611]|uniref:Helix-turn-helix family protein n=1 Tax=Enterobacter cloacae S611 TaxID=1399146 RepID=A0ABP2ZNY8_ENTCL|nr:helix-turn-helix family protein [Enterobacter cloacae S611]